MQVQQDVAGLELFAGRECLAGAAASAGAEAAAPEAALHDGGECRVIVYQQDPVDRVVHWPGTCAVALASGRYRVATAPPSPAFSSSMRPP